MPVTIFVPEESKKNFTAATLRQTRKEKTLLHFQKAKIICNMWWYYNLKGRKKEGQSESLNGPFLTKEKHN